MEYFLVIWLVNRLLNNWIVEDVIRRSWEGAVQLAVWTDLVSILEVSVSTYSTYLNKCHSSHKRRFSSSDLFLHQDGSILSNTSTVFGPVWKPTTTIFDYLSTVAGDTVDLPVSKSTVTILEYLPPISDKAVGLPETCGSEWTTYYVIAPRGYRLEDGPEAVWWAGSTDFGHPSWGKVFAGNQRPQPLSLPFSVSDRSTTTLAAHSPFGKSATSADIMINLAILLVVLTLFIRTVYYLVSLILSCLKSLSLLLLRLGKSFINIDSDHDWLTATKTLLWEWSIPMVGRWAWDVFQLNVDRLKESLTRWFGAIGRRHRV